jgi:hypothetical protein
MHTIPRTERSDKEAHSPEHDSGYKNTLSQPMMVDIKAHYPNHGTGYKNTLP